MFSPYMRRILIDIFLVLALIMGFLYAKDTYVDFLISLFHFSSTGTTSLNVSSIAYCIMRFLFIFIPLIMLTAIEPRKHFNKSNMLKVTFITIGVCYILANSWIIYFIVENDITPVLNASIPVIFTDGALKESIIEATNECYLFQYNDAHVFNTIVWNSYDLWGILFSFIQGFLYINLAINLNNHRSVFLTKYIVITLISVALPTLYTALMAENHINTPGYSAISWGGRNLFLIFEAIFVCMALKLGSSSKAFWSDILF